MLIICLLMSFTKLLVAILTFCIFILGNPLIAQTGPWANSHGTLKGEAMVRDASGGYLKDVQSIVEGGGDVNWQLESGLSPLMGAAGGGHLEIVKFLISKGADPYLKAKDGRTALSYAKDGGASDVVKYLTNYKPGAEGETANQNPALSNPPPVQKEPTGPWAKFNGTMKGQALVRDASGGYLKDVQSIVEGGGDVNWQLSSGLSPLMGASGAGHLDIVKFLISNGADPLLKDENGLTAIDYAKRNGSNDVVTYLNGLSSTGNVVVPVKDTTRVNNPVVIVPAAPIPKPEEKKPAVPVATKAVPWAAFGSYKVGAKVKFFAGSWKTGTVKEIGPIGDYTKKNAAGFERKYLVTRDGEYSWDESVDWGKVTGVIPETYWTGFFIGKWKLGEVMAVNTRTEGNYQRDEYSFYTASEVLSVTADKKYVWKNMDGKEMKGTWKAAEDGAGIILLKGFQGLNWTLRNETNAVEENIRGLQTARLTTPGKMSIKAQRPIQ